MTDENTKQLDKRSELRDLYYNCFQKMMETLSLYGCENEIEKNEKDIFEIINEYPDRLENILYHLQNMQGLYKQYLLKEDGEYDKYEIAHIYVNNHGVGIDMVGLICEMMQDVLSIGTFIANRKLVEKED